MFTVAQIEMAHAKVNSGADFPKYIQEIKQMGVVIFETWVYDSRTDYFGNNDFKTQSMPQYQGLVINDVCKPEAFELFLKSHQQGQTDYYQFCKHCAQTGIEKWIVNLYTLTCTYYDKAGNTVLVERIPT